jgi:hypothetical protein
MQSIEPGIVNLQSSTGGSDEPTIDVLPITCSLNVVEA